MFEDYSFKTEGFSATNSWMDSWFDRLNQELFGGVLQKCDLSVFSSGKDSGNALGWFSINNDNIRIERGSRQMYDASHCVNLSGKVYGKTYIDSKNFVQMCQPSIQVNGNYTGNELVFLNTLIHEMCHYYTYYNGYAPKQPHGVEFKRVAAMIARKTNNFISIQRLSTADEMSQIAFTDEFKKSKKAEFENRRKRILGVLVFKINGNIDLTLTSNEALINGIVRTRMRAQDTIKIYEIDDPNFVYEMFIKGFRKNMRSYRWWRMDEDNRDTWFIPLFEKSKKRQVYLNPEYEDEDDFENDMNVRQAAKERGDETTMGSDRNFRPTKIFSIKTSNGLYETEFENKEDLYMKLKERFPNMRDDVIEKIINNEANYKTK